MPSQVESGRAFEYGLANAFYQLYPNSVFVDNAAKNLVRAAYRRVSPLERQSIARAALSAASFLSQHDPNLAVIGGYKIHLQSDQRGVEGDVRDIIITRNATEVGISAKNRHRAVKHSRLSETIDFGNLWFGVDAASSYFAAIRPIFTELRQLTQQGTYWRSLGRKAERFYLPVLAAFRDEAVRLCGAHPESPRSMVEYMLGRYDFYKVVKENGSISIQAFNLHNSLGWGRRVNYPARLIEARLKDNSTNTMVFTFDQGWQFSFRIHNARSLVEPSLKFDIQIIGLPPSISQQNIP